MVIEERYGEAPEYSYSAGKPKFSQAVNGVQTWHDYEATTEHGAIHKHTVTTKADGELVAAQSRKTEVFIAANDTTVFEQESIWDGSQWLLHNTTAYEYDAQHRVTKTTLLPKKNSPETLKSEVNAATKQAESMCEKEKTTLLQVRIIIKPTDDDGVKYLNKSLKNTQKSKKQK